MLLPSTERIFQQALEPLPTFNPPDYEWRSHALEMLLEYFKHEREMYNRSINFAASTQGRAVASLISIDERFSKLPEYIKYYTEKLISIKRHANSKDYFDLWASPPLTFDEWLCDQYEYRYKPEF